MIGVLLVRIMMRFVTYIHHWLVSPILVAPTPVHTMTEQVPAHIWNWLEPFLQWNGCHCTPEISMMGYEEWQGSGCPEGGGKGSGILLNNRFQRTPVLLM